MSDFNANLAALLAILERDHLVVTDIENDAAWPVNAHVIDTIAQAQSLTRELEEAKEALATLVQEGRAAAQALSELGFSSDALCLAAHKAVNVLSRAVSGEDD